jgi:hypothetical protein
MKSTITPPMTDSERELITAWVKGYVKSLANTNSFYEDYDEFHSYNDNWDINSHCCNGKKNTVSVVAHPQYDTGTEGVYFNTEMSQWVEIMQFDYKGNPKQKETAQ